MQCVAKHSTCWSRSNDLWVMSPTRFLCAKVLEQVQYMPLPHSKQLHKQASHDTRKRTDVFFTHHQSTLSTDSALHRYGHLEYRAAHLLRSSAAILVNQRLASTFIHGNSARVSGILGRCTRDRTVVKPCWYDGGVSHAGLTVTRPDRGTALR